MRILTDAAPLGDDAPPVHLALGVFDGVHLGHQMVIRQSLADAEESGGVAVVVTFDRHPASIVDPASAPPLVQPLWRRLDAIEETGVENVLVFTFDEAFSRQAGETFVSRLASGFGRLSSVSVGEGFVFGHRRSGDVALLEQMGSRLAFRVHGIPPLQLGGKVVSSSQVRERIGSGDFGGASSLLGRPYDLAGEVVAGDRMGSQIGFPTANLAVDGIILPPNGVYAAVAQFGRSRKPAAVNIGFRPTVGGRPGAIRVEAHLLDFEGDLYGERLQLEFRGRLRGEERFGSLEQLAAQIERDVEAVRTWSRNGGLP